MSEEMQPIHPVTAALIMGKTPDPCEPMIEIPCKVLTRLMDVVEFGDQLERVEKDRLLANLKDMLAEEQPELWVIHSVGPNELHPMISKEAAEQHAAELAEMFKDMSNKYGCRFDVIRSPFSPLEHFEILAEETIEHRNDLMEYVKELEQKAAAAVVNQQLTTAGPTNAHGLDADYFIKLCAREFNPDVIRNQNPKDLARAFARAARTACAEVLKEREFQQVVLVVADLNLTTAARDVLAERQRQVTAEDWTPEHDDEHNGGELAAVPE